MRAVRDFFDYFLTAQHDVSADTLDALIRREVAAQLEGTAAQTEALDLWQRYGAYRDAVARVGALQATQAVPADTANGAPIDLDTMQSTLDERASIAGRTMGLDWSEAFFGSEWRRARYDLARWRTMADSALTDAQKAARLQTLADTLPPAERTALEREARRQASVTAIAQWRTQGLPPDQLRAAATEALGAEAAQRVLQMQTDEDAWITRYSQYAVERAHIDAMRLAPADRDAQLGRLRDRSFATRGERLRAALLDRGSASLPSADAEPYHR
ncbi:lipase secretion chaperone [Trinickia sp. EG282A]|uniref:lipase secretion chaperone n=1 Tax=Trinickia sp. EG282A TaxID=3237013 RepID=UPI0034D1FFF5